MRELAASYSRKARRVIRDDGLAFFLRVAATNAIQMVTFPITTRRIRSCTREQGIEQVVDYAFNGGFSILRPFQIRSEIIDFLEELDRKNPKNIIEIGTARGGTLFLFTRVAADNATLISIDLMDKNCLGGYPLWKASFFRSFAHKEQKIHLIRADSHDIGTLNDVKGMLGEKNVDLLFIDGDHSYAGVKRDFELYSPLVGKGGIVAFHDIGQPKEGTHGVNIFWNEIKDQFNCREIIEDRNQGWAGIGLLYMK